MAAAVGYVAKLIKIPGCIDTNKSQQSLKQIPGCTSSQKKKFRIHH